MGVAENALAKKPAAEDITIPEWSDEVLEVRQLTALDWDSLIDVTHDEEGKQILASGAAELVVRALYHKSGEMAGKRVFTDAQAAELANTPYGPVRAAYAVAWKLNYRDRKTNEDAEKNSSAGQSGDSPTG